MQYVSWRPEPRTDAVDLNWKKLENVLFSFFQHYKSGSTKIHTDKIADIVVAWNWAPKTYATLIKTLINQPIFIKISTSRLKLPGKASVRNIWERLDMLMCLLFGDPSKITNFWKMLRTSLCHHWENGLPNNTNPTSTNGNVKSLDTPINNVLLFNGNNTTISTLSNVVSLSGDDNIQFGK